jgi:AraC-like DNA-binding protein
MKTTLANLILRKKQLAELLRLAAHSTTESWCIEDIDGQLVFGQPPNTIPQCYDIIVESELIGRVKSETASGQFIAAMLQNWLRQESEKRQVGAEALHLYREINLIFSFSEKLSKALNAQEVANVTLTEAAQIIPFAGGAVFFWNEKTTKMQLVTQTDDSLIAKRPPSFFQEIVGNGKSEIFASTENEIWLCAALKIGDRVLGSIMLNGENFSASDLKFISTLAVQAAAALENSMQHERITAEALKVQREKLTLELALKNPFFKKVMAVIEAQYRNPAFTVTDLSKKLNLSPSQLQRKMTALTDLSPLQIIRDLRFAHAKDLLKITDFTVSEVAFESGFNDPSYFARIFLKEFGKAPTIWKEEQAKESGP